MRGRAPVMWVVGAVVAAWLCACGGTNRVSATTSVSVGCPVSAPGGPRPPHRALVNFGSVMTRPSDPRLYGNGVLWTVLPWTDQAVRVPGRSVRLKIPWFRAQTGSIRIDATPVNGPPARFTADVGTPAEYGRYGFAPSILQFGRAGCWRLHARLASHVLTVVVRVRRVARAA